MDRQPGETDAGIEMRRMGESPLLTVRELAEFLNVTESTIYKMVERGEIPVMRLGQRGRTLRFRREKIQKWLKTFES